MNEEIIKRHIGTVQFGVLALIFALPWVSGHALQPVSSKSLSTILEFEFVVLILGWLSAGLFFVPMAVLDSVWLRRINLLLALLEGPWMMYRYFSAGPAWLELRTEELRDYDRLIAEGFVPSYSNAVERQSIEPVIIAYRLSLPPREDEFIRVKTPVKQVVTKGLIQSNSRRGTHFQIDCAIPGPAMKSKAEGTVHVWHLQIGVSEKKLVKFTPVTNMKKDRELLEHWSLAFTLPV